MTKDTNNESIRLDPKIIIIDEGGTWLNASKIHQEQTEKILSMLPSLESPIVDDGNDAYARRLELMAAADLKTEFMRAMLSKELLDKISAALPAHLAKLTVKGELTMVEAIIIKDLFLKGVKELYP